MKIDAPKFQTFFLMTNISISHEDWNQLNSLIRCKMGNLNTEKIRIISWQQTLQKLSNCHNIAIPNILAFSTTWHPDAKKIECWEHTRLLPISFRYRIHAKHLPNVFKSIYYSKSQTWIERIPWIRMKFDNTFFKGCRIAADKKNAIM